MIDLGPIEKFDVGTLTRVDVRDLRLCVINVEGDFYVLDDRCSHADFSLSEGSLDEKALEVECPKHGALFDVTNGEARCLPATKPVKSYAVFVEDGLLKIQEDSDA